MQSTLTNEGSLPPDSERQQLVELEQCEREAASLADELDVIDLGEDGTALEGEEQITCDRQEQDKNAEEQEIALTLSDEVSDQKLIASIPGAGTRVYAEQQHSVIEISPGVEVLLRGAKETRQAVAEDFIVEATCVGCTLNLHCIRDAEYLLCPLCFSVSPIIVPTSSTMLDPEEHTFGVGLGFISDD